MTVRIIEDPLFQLNLVIFLSLYFPPGSRIKPVLYHAGYRLFKISPDLVLPPELITRLATIPCGVQRQVKPEVLLRNSVSGKVLIVECKKSSFSSNSNTARQAVAYLVLRNNILRDSLAQATHESWNSSLAYLVTCGNEELLSLCLSELSDLIQKQGIAVNSSNVLGIDQQEDGIYLNLNYASALDEISATSTSVRVIESNEEEDIRILYLIPLDINVSRPDEYTKQVVNSRIKSSFVSLMMRSVGTNPCKIEIDELLRRSLQLWDIWEDNESKKYLRKAAKKFVRKQLSTLRRNLGITYAERANSNSFEISVSTTLKDKLERFFMSRDYMEEKITAFPGQLDLDLEG